MRNCTRKYASLRGRHGPDPLVTLVRDLYALAGQVKLSLNLAVFLKWKLGEYSTNSKHRRLVCPKIPSRVSGRLYPAVLRRLQNLVLKRAELKLKLEKFFELDIPLVMDCLNSLGFRVCELKTNVALFCKRPTSMLPPWSLEKFEEALYDFDSVKLLFDYVLENLKDLEEKWHDTAYDYVKAGKEINEIVTNISDRQVLGSASNPHDVVVAAARSTRKIKKALGWP